MTVMERPGGELRAKAGERRKQRRERAEEEEEEEEGVVEGE